MSNGARDVFARTIRSCAAKLRGAAGSVAAAAAAEGDPTLILASETALRGRPDLSGVSEQEPNTRPSRLAAERWAQRTDWRRGMAAPFRAFASAETGGAALLIVAIAVALVWTNLPWHSSYDGFWSSTIAVNVGGHLVATDFRGVINDGLMTLFFLVVGLEGKRELDLGELRDRSRLTVPVVAGMMGICASVVVYVGFTSGSGGAGGWGVAVSTDTALALGTLALVHPGRSGALRVFLLTVLVIDDLVSLVVITLFYPAKIHPVALITAAALFATLMALREYGRRHRDDEGRGAGLFAVSVLMGFALWLALFQAGVDPVITGLVIGLLTSAYAPRQSDLERGRELARSFRLDPSPESARAASSSLAGTISPNERLQYRLEPWTSRVIVPLFALANAGVHLNSRVISEAVSSPITWGIIVAFAAGKPVGMLSAAWITAEGAPRRGKLAVSWSQLLGTASAAGVGFTVSLLIAARAFNGSRLADAKLGVLGTAILAPLLSGLAFRSSNRERQEEDQPRAGAARLPPPTQHVFDLAHLPLDDVLPGAQLAAEAAEAAGAQGAFWPMHDELARAEQAVTLATIYRAARDTHLDLDVFFADLGAHKQRARVARDVLSADESGVAGTPAFFIDRERYAGPFDADSLTAVIRQALNPAGAATAPDAEPEPSSS